MYHTCGNGCTDSGSLGKVCRQGTGAGPDYTCGLPVKSGQIEGLLSGFSLRASPGP